MSRAGEGEGRPAGDRLPGFKKRSVKPQTPGNGPVVQLRRAGLFKGLLFLGAVVLAAALFFSTHFLVLQVRDSSRSYLQLSVSYYKSMLLGDNPGLAYQAVQDINFPIVVTDDEGNPKFWKNLEIAADDTTHKARLRVIRIVEQMDRLGNQPIPLEIFPGEVDYFHYGDPSTVRLLRGLSITSALAVALYVLLGYIGFRTVRKAEERSVWIGMARETAHQLGTPISSLMGWLEVLGERGGDAAEKMKQDVARLERIAVRFSKIGTRESLKPSDLGAVVEGAVEYMRGRVGSGVSIVYRNRGSGSSPMQPDLIGWVFENLIRNAAQSMEGEGEVLLTSGVLENGSVYVDVADRGEGIAALEHETIFRPGYTSRKSGWGLGLSLGRRIIEDMHRGRLYVHESRPGVGTTMRMVLPS